MKSRVIKTAALFTAVIMAACVFTACKKHTHTPDYGLDGAKPWEESCECGHKTGDVDYTKMTLQQFFDEMLNNEGNFIIDRLDERDNYRYECRWEVNGKTSYAYECEIDYDNEYVGDYYQTFLDNGFAAQIENYDDGDWKISKYSDNIQNLWLDWNGRIFYYETITPADFTKNGNVYTAAKDDLASVITFNKNNIVMVNTWEVIWISTYTITLGNAPTIAIPQECKDLLADFTDNIFMMFDIAPNDFGIFSGGNEWDFYDVNKVDDFVEILEARGYTLDTTNIYGNNINSASDMGIWHISRFGTFVQKIGDIITIRFTMEGTPNNLGYQICLYMDA